MDDQSYVEDDFERDTDYIDDRITDRRRPAGQGQPGRSSRTATGWWPRVRARGRTARSSCAACSASRTC